MQYLAWMGNQEGGDGNAGVLGEADDQATQGSSVEQKVSTLFGSHTVQCNGRLLSQGPRQTQMSASIHLLSHLRSLKTSTKQI